jgi:hypothetical protein
MKRREQCETCYLYFNDEGSHLCGWNMRSIYGETKAKCKHYDDERKYQKPTKIKQEVSHG